MAVTGKAIIAPVTDTTGFRHHMEDISVDVPTGQDGIWSAPAAGTRVSDIYVSEGSGTVGYGMRIGATSSSSDGMYRGIELFAPQHGLQLINVERTSVNQLHIALPRKHGIYLTDSNENKITDALIVSPSYSNSDTYDGIYGNLADDNQFDGIMIPESGTTYMRYAVNLESSYDNQLNGAMLDAGLTKTFHESSYLDNDFGLEMTTWSLAKVIDTIGTGALLLPFGTDCEVYAIELRLRVAPTGSSVIVDVNKNDTTIFPTTAKPTIVTSATQNVAFPDTTFVNASQYLTVDIDQADSNAVAEGLTVTARWRRV